jgi:transcription elongation factor Elf1
MPCPHCLSRSISTRKHRTSLGYRTFSCRACGPRVEVDSASSCFSLPFSVSSCRSRSTGQ